MSRFRFVGPSPESFPGLGWDLRPGDVVQTDLDFAGDPRFQAVKAQPPAKSDEPQSKPSKEA